MNTSRSFARMGGIFLWSFTEEVECFFACCWRETILSEHVADAVLLYLFTEG